MQICCTKKLLDEMEIVPQKVIEENDLFCWSAHLITINRRKAVIVVNDSNRFGFILYGLKAKDLKHIGELITQGIKISLRDEKIKEEIIEQYLNTARDVIFTKTRGAKYVARLNKVCELTGYLSDKLDPNVLIQISASRVLNGDLIKADKSSNYTYPYELLTKDFEAFAGQPIIRCKMLDLMVRLNLESYAALRRILVPSDCTFTELHQILQIIFDWKNYHLYEFTILGEAEKPILNVISRSEQNYEPLQGSKTVLDTGIKLSDYADNRYKVVYTYDYGDNWEHEVTINRTIEDYDKNYPVCVLGEGNAPPEDVGGVSGYLEFLEIMSDPMHQEYENTRRWLKSQWYKDFDNDLVNRRLRNVLRR